MLHLKNYQGRETSLGKEVTGSLIQTLQNRITSGTFQILILFERLCGLNTGHVQTRVKSKLSSFRPRSTNRKRSLDKNDLCDPPKKISKEDLNNINYRDIYENIFKVRIKKFQKKIVPKN